MNARSPIVILGFGRSGTTWVADIVSKAIGGLIAFEPFHPATCSFSAEVCYTADYDINAIDQHWRRVQNKEVRNRWLLRNHINSPLEEVPSRFVDMVWRESDIMGFKSIRLNHMASRLSEQWNTKPIAIIRNPLAVIASIVRRERFWEEYGWEWHRSAFIERTHYCSKDIARLLTSDVGMMAYMWAASNSILLVQLSTQGIAPFYYEDLYSQPYQTTRMILSHVDQGDRSLHPSYMFTPSMTTLRTLHDIRSTEEITDQSFFWKDTLTDQDQSIITQVIRHVCKQSEELHEVCTDRNYLP